ncbi:MAG: YkgJ family cysteine cluster protein [Candidatus Eremiobacterota bacterium]
MHFVENQRFECRDCSRCCRGWGIVVTEGTRERLRGSQLELRILQEHGQALVDNPDGGLPSAAKQPDGACVFLDERELCRIHSEFGGRAKPIGCRQFPFLIRPTPDGTFVAASFYCPRIQENVGQDLSAYAGEIDLLMEDFAYKPVGFEPIGVKDGLTLDWPTYRELERRMLEWLDRDGPDAAVCRAMAGVGRMLAEGPPLQRDPAEDDPMLAVVREFCLATVVSTVEAAHPEVAQQLTETLLEGGRVDLRKLEWQGEVPAMSTFLSPGEPFVEQGIARFLRSLLFRKFLALGDALMDHLTELWLLPGLLRFYRHVAGQKFPDCSPEQHLYRGYDEAEMMFTHSAGLGPLLGAFSNAYLRQLVQGASGLATT